MTERQSEILNLLQKWIEEEFCQVNRVEINGVVYLQFTPSVFLNETGLVFMEICLFRHSDELDVAQIYSTIIPKPRPHMDALREKLNQWNLESLAGAYGIYEKLDQLYHKHNLALVNDGMPNDQADFIFYNVCLTLEEIARHLEEALHITA